ncbi:hypothetical protein JCM6882_003814 [Rhodosporidiobolus microsporus]
MVGILGLPDELLLRIVGLLGADLKVYSDRERQTDLARVATINSRFCLVAHTLLYGGAVNVRSAGRTFLLSRTLSSNDSLAALVRFFTAKSEIDFGHPVSLVKIIGATRLEAVTLSSIFFTKHPTADLYTALQTHTQLSSFSYGFRGVDNPLSPIAPLLQSWPNLQHLDLDRVAALDRNASTDPLSKSRELRTWGPPPSYRLSSLAFSNCRTIDTVGWPLIAFKWLLGGTNALTSLSLVGFDGVFDLAQLFSLLSARGCDTSLERLTVRNFRDASHHSHLPDFTLSSAFDPNALSTYFPALSYLSLANNDGETCFAVPKPCLRLPPSLRLLELHEDLFLEWKLARTVSEEIPTTFKKIKLVGPFPTDPDVKLLKEAAEDRGLLFEVERAF